MKKLLKKLFPWILGLIFLLTVAAATRQIIGPSTETTPNAIARWTDNSAWKLTNSVVIIDDSGNMSGINIQSMAEINASTIYTTNGVVFLQKSAAPTAGNIGGTVGSVTNHMVVSVGGKLYDYWSDGTTLWGPKQLAP